MKPVDAYDKDTNCVTENTFQRLERGMSVQEIVSILGCLYRCRISVHPPPGDSGGDFLHNYKKHPQNEK